MNMENIEKVFTLMVLLYFILFGFDDLKPFKMN